MEDKPGYERIKDENFRIAVSLIDAGDTSGLENHLRRNPRLVSQHIKFDENGYFSNPCLLNFIAENPVRQGFLPENIVKITHIILEAGAKQNLDQTNYTLGLVCSGSVARKCQFQIPLINLLLSYGADGNSAIPPAIAQGEFEAVEFLIEKGAKIDLVTAAGTGRTFQFQTLFSDSTEKERHLAFAFAAQHGHTEILKILLKSGADPDRYNPEGAHMFSTPLHQAIIFGHEEIVRLLVDGGARLDLKDTIYQGTPLDWARYAKNNTIENYLLSKL